MNLSNAFNNARNMFWLFNWLKLYTNLMINHLKVLFDSLALNEN